jgi:membrane protein implicated in regulation of membrane protease activity
MGSLLAWYNLIFYIALTVGILFALGSALGMGHDDHDAGGGHDAGGDGHGHDFGHGHGHDHEHDLGHGHASPHELHGQVSWFSDMLGVGRVPFTIILMLLFMLFGGVGVMSNVVLSKLLASPSLFFPISGSVALLATFFLTGRTARLINRVMPTSESYNVTKLDLVGKVGKVVATAEGDYAVASVKDHEGNVQQISCRTGGGALPVGQEILVLEYDAGTGQYLVEAYSSDAGPAA